MQWKKQRNLQIVLKVYEKFIFIRYWDLKLLDILSIEGERFLLFILMLTKEKQKELENNSNLTQMGPYYTAITLFK